MMSYGTQAERGWHLDEAAAEPIVKAAVDGGITYFDTADTYSGGVSEQITGRLLGRFFGRREDYVLATRCRTSGTTPAPTSTSSTGWPRSRPNGALPRPRSRLP